MAAFLSQHLGTILVGLLVLGALTGAAIHLRRQKKKGGCAGCGCEGCSKQSDCGH